MPRKCNATPDYVLAIPVHFRAGNCVYLLKGRELGRYKIGKTNLLSRRIRDINGLCSEMIDFVHAIMTESHSKLEEYLHWKYKNFRHHGEWFDLHEDHVSYIVGITASNVGNILWAWSSYKYKRSIGIRSEEFFGQ
jgi:hypothetical protein